MNHRIMADDNYTPRGPDGKGWNRVVMGCGNMAYPTERCMLKPVTWQAAWESHNRPSLASPLQFGTCSSNGNCEGCPVANQQRVSYVGSALIGVIREAEDGSVWILNRRDKGWGEFGYRYNNWADFVQHENVLVGNRKIDEHGFYFEIASLKEPKP